MSERLTSALAHRALSASPWIDFAFDPRQPRDKDGKWTVVGQHVAGEANAQTILREGFRSDVGKWDQSFGPGVYFGEAGDRKSAKFYARQGTGRDPETSQVITAELSLRNPLHVTIRNHSEFRQQAVAALGGKEKLVELAQAKYDAAVKSARKHLTRELKADNPEAFKELDLTRPDHTFYWDFSSEAYDRALAGFKRETGMDYFNDLGDWRELASDPDPVLRSGPQASDNYGHQSTNIGTLVKEAGYDGIVINTSNWGGVGGTQVVVFDTSGIKVLGVQPYDRRKNRAVTAAVEEFYSPDQPRDKQGQFATVRAGKGFGGVSAHPDNRVKPTSKLTLDSFTSERWFRAAVKGWFDGDLGDGYHAQIEEHGIGVQADVANRRATGSVSGHILTKHGDVAGYFERNVHYDKGVLSVEHVSFMTYDQAAGIGAKFNAHSVAKYREAGVDRVTTYAAETVGGYAWAREGFRIAYEPRRAEEIQRLTTGFDAIKSAAILEMDGHITKDQLKQVVAGLEALEAASSGGEDVQPIHIASLGEDTMRFTKRTEGGRTYETWPGKEVMLGAFYAATYYFDANKAVTAAAVHVHEFYSPTQPRDKEGRWTAHRGSITSLSRDTLDRAIAKGVEGIFPHGSPTGVAPWPTAPRRKGEKVYDPALVEAALNKPPVLEKVDPRILFATQPGLAREHVDYYRGDEYRRTGRTSADRDRPSNRFPIVYVNKRGQHILLTGHHRAAADLVEGRDLDAIVVRES